MIVVDEDINNEYYHLDWLGKSEAYKQSLVPSVATLQPCIEKSINFDNSDNMFIEGDNLEALKLLQTDYLGAVKMIYIDPPYNTGKTFIYSDKFSETKKNYLKRINNKKVSIHEKDWESGHLHSQWLNMMAPRLLLARNLLRDDGVIFVSIDDNEFVNLRMLMDEIFGCGNFIASLPWKCKGAGNNSKFINVAHEYILFYVKSKSCVETGREIKKDEVFPKYDEIKKRRYKLRLVRKDGAIERRIDNPTFFYGIKGLADIDIYPKTPDGKEGIWRWCEKRMYQEIQDGNVEVIKRGDEYVVYKKLYEPLEGEHNTKIYTTWLDDVGNTATGTKEIKELFGERMFPYPKSTVLLKRLLNIAGVKDDDIILDFFAGSGSTAQAVMEFNEEPDVYSKKTNLKFICIQLPEVLNEKSEAYTAGYKTIADITVARISKVIEKINMEREKTLPLENQTSLGFRVFVCK